MYEMKNLIKIKDEGNQKYKNLFEEFFTDHIVKKKIVHTDNKIQKIILKKFEDLDEVYSTEGFYVILSDYKLKQNQNEYCLFEEKAKSKKMLKAVYRGEASHRRERLTGHLFNKNYNGRDTNFMNVGSNNGINIDELPFKNYHWMVVSYSLPSSDQSMRKQMELAFDKIFGNGNKPMFSKK